MGQSFDSDVVKFNRAAALLCILDVYNKLSPREQRALSHDQLLKDLWPNGYYLGKQNLKFLSFNEMINAIIAGPCLQAGTYHIDTIRKHLQEKLGL